MIRSQIFLEVVLKIKLISMKKNLDPKSENLLKREIKSEFFKEK